MKKIYLLCVLSVIILLGGFQSEAANSSGLETIERLETTNGAATNADKVDNLSQSQVERKKKASDLVIDESKKEENLIKVNVTVGNKIFVATFYDNVTAKAFIERMPLSLNMSELNSNEKYNKLGEGLPTHSTEKPSVIYEGEIMCWSGDTLVLFYETFSNTYGGYVRLGSINDVSGLRAALGKGNSTVIFNVVK